MDKITIAGKTFYKYIDNLTIHKAINVIADAINSDFANQEVVFLGVLNGAFLFSAELLQKINIPNQVSFIKLSSYKGTGTAGTVKEIMGLDISLKDKTVIILEDIVDTGLTLDYVYGVLEAQQPKEIQTATLFFKPDTFKGKNEPKYKGMKIPDLFIVGFGLDYNGYGRNYSDIYVIDKNNT